MFEGGTRLYGLLADAVLLLHFSFVLFVVIGLVLIAIGGWRGWPWVRRLWFRIAHLAAIGVVAAQAWLGQACPLTLLEIDLRARAGQAGYGGSFIEHWVSQWLYFQAPAWVFTTLYTLFALVVVGAWLLVPPASARQTRHCESAQGPPE